VKPKATFVGSNPVTVQGRRIGDVIHAVMTGGLVTMFVWAGLYACLQQRPSDFPTALISAVGAIYFGWTFVGAIWRLRQRLPVFTADNIGFRVHASLATQTVPWTNVQSIGLKVGSLRIPDVVRIRLKKRIWSWGHPFGTHDLRLALPYLGLDRGEIADLLRQLRRLRGATVVSDK
jgi:hypothetical protein